MQKMFSRIAVVNFLIIILFSGPMVSIQADDEFDIPLEAIEEIEKPSLLTRALDEPEKNFCAAVDALGEAFNAPIWAKTEVPMGRNVLYLLPHKITAIEHGGFVLNLFFNTTGSMAVSANSLLKTDTINLDTMQMIMEELFKGNEMSSEDLASLNYLFRKVSIQERRAGSLIQGGFVKGPFSVQLNTSFHLAERNFWLSKKDRQEISDLLAGMSSGGSVEEQEFYRIRVGMGDTRLKCGVNTLNMTNFQLDAGVEGIAPTSRFSYAPRLNVLSGQDIKVDQLDTLKNDLGEVLRGVRDYLINPRLGNNGHFGLGCYLESKADVFKGLAQIWTRLSFDKLFANEEDRLIMFKQVKTTDQIRADARAALLAAANPDPLITGPLMATVRKDAKDLVQQYLFPSAFTTTVYPGGVVNAVLAVSTDIKKMKFSVGYDFYAQQSERIKKIHNTNVSLQDLRIEDAELPSTYQHKIFAETMYVRHLKRSVIGFGLGGDMTMFSKGIGSDWTVYTKLSMSF